ncbi:MAG: hypothetical protein ACOC2U_02510 [bacterium]
MSIFIDDDYNGSVENVMASDIDTDQFFHDMKRLDINFDIFFTNVENIDKSEFNYLLREIKDWHGYDILETVLHIEKRHIDMKKIMKLLDKESYQHIKIELADKYNKEIEISTLRSFFE